MVSNPQSISSFAFQIHHIFPRELFLVPEIQSEFDRLFAGQEKEISLDASGNKIALFQDSAATSLVRQSYAEGDSKLSDAGYGGGYHPLGSHPGYNDFIIYQTKKILSNPKLDDAEKRSELWNLHEFATRISQGVITFDGGELGISGKSEYSKTLSSAYQLYESDTYNGSIGEAARLHVEVPAFEHGDYVDHFDSSLTDSGSLNNSEERLKTIVNTIDLIRPNLPQEKYDKYVAKIDEIHAKIAEGGLDTHATWNKMAALGRAISYDVNKHGGLVPGSDFHDTAGTHTENLAARSILDGPGPIDNNPDRVIDSAKQIGDALQSKAGLLPEKFSDFDGRTQFDIHTAIDSVSRALGSSVISDVTGFLNGSYDALKKGIATGDWGDFEHVAVTYGVNAVLGMAMVVGSVGLTALVFGTGAGELVAAAWEVYNIYQSMEDIGGLVDKLFTDLSTIDFGLSDAMAAICGLFERSCTDPIVLDLGGDGVALTPIADSHASFDLHATGYAVHTGWIGANDAFLVIDRNGDGKVNDITELFGDGDTDGFTSLARIDSNHDGFIDARDTAFASLRLWVDADSDGVTDTGELKTLSGYGIKAIDLSATGAGGGTGGDTIGAVGTYVRTNGTTGQVAEAYFANDTALSHYQGTTAYDPGVWMLPDLRGYGTAPNLWIAMSLDPTLKAMVADFAALTIADTSALQSAILPILYRWAGVENMAPGSRGNYVDARHLAVLEKFVGQGYDFRGSSNPIYSHQGQLIESSFQSLEAAVGARLMLLGPLRGAFDELHFDFATDSFALPDDVTSLPTLLIDNSPEDFAEAAGFWAEWYSARPLLEILADALDLPSADMAADFEAAFATLHLPFTLDQALYGRVFAGTEANDALTGTFAGDFLQGLAGDDALTGGQGDDTYYFKRGDGNDRITDQGAASDQDKLVLAGVTPGDLRVIQHADKLILLIDDGAGGRIDLTDQFSDKGGVESVHFGDGTVWSEADLLAHAVSSDGTIVTHLGTTDDDTIAGSTIGDLIEGRVGDDDLAGGTGDDTYLFYRGDGNDRITEESSGGKADRLVLHGIAPDAVTLSASGNDVVVTIAESAAGRGDGGTVTLTDELLSGNYAGIDTIVFDDGTTWAPTGIDVWLAHGEMNANVAYNLVLDNILDSLETAPETVTPAALDALNVLLPALTQFATDDLGPFLRGLLEDGVAPLLTGDFASLGPALVEAVHNLGPVVDGTGTLLLPATGQTLDLLIPAVSHFLFADVVPALAQKLIVHGLIPATTADHADIAALLTDSFEFLVPAVSQAADTLLPAATHIVADDVLPVVGGLLTDAIAPALSGELNSLEPTLNHLAGNLGTVVAGIGDTLVPALGDVVGDLLPATAGFLDQALPVVGTIVADTLVPALTGGAAAPQTAADDLFDFAVPAVTGIVDAVAPPVTDLVTGSVLPVVSDILVDGVAPVLSGNLNSLGTTVVDAVETLVPAAVETVAEVVTGLGSHVSSFLKNLLSPQHADHFHFL